MKVSRQYIEAQVQVALAEDIGDGDRTAVVVPEPLRATAALLCRQQAILCGTSWFAEVFRRLDPGIVVHWQQTDGARIDAGEVICRLEGQARAILTGERVALNFLQTLSGTATLAGAYVERVAGTGVRILDTRKTIPGLRLAQKYAVRCGGADNHRVGLYDAILIKENHIAAAGSLQGAFETAQRANPGIEIEVEVEVEDLDQLQIVLGVGAQRVLLDNFSHAELVDAVRLNDGRARLEASGNVNLDTVRGIAETGVDDISVGGLTKDVRAVDLSLLFD